MGNFPKFPKRKSKDATHIWVPEEYFGLTTQERLKEGALKASDNGRCWWIYQHIMQEERKK
jgi:hypothetical protein